MLTAALIIIAVIAAIYIVYFLVAFRLTHLLHKTALQNQTGRIIRIQILPRLAIVGKSSVDKTEDGQIHCSILIDTEKIYPKPKRV